MTLSGDSASLRLLFAFFRVNERYGDFSPVETIAGGLDYFRLADKD
jgi:hypothetical protein